MSRMAWAREIQAIAQTGLAFEPNQWDRERYERLRRLAAEMMSAEDADQLEATFSRESGYATPKADVRAAAFRDGHILLVREVADEHRWTLPGGWADVGLTAAENAAKEMREESGFLVRVDKLAAVLDRTRQGHPEAPFHAYKHFFICTIIGGAATPSNETSEIGFFAEDALPADLSVERTTKAQLHLMFAHHRDPGRATDYD
jgi:ADP-ribose pyrophosphatase YjhB (NUDIX family)